MARTPYTDPHKIQIRELKKRRRAKRSQLNHIIGVLSGRVLDITLKSRLRMYARARRLEREILGLETLITFNSSTVNG